MGTSNTELTGASDALDVARAALSDAREKSQSTVEELLLNDLLGETLTDSENSVANFEPEDFDNEDNRQRAVDYTEGFTHGVEALAEAIAVGLLVDDNGVKAQLSILRGAVSAARNLVALAQAGLVGDHYRARVAEANQVADDLDGMVEKLQALLGDNAIITD